MSRHNSIPSSSDGSTWSNVSSGSRRTKRRIASCESDAVTASSPSLSSRCRTRSNRLGFRSEIRTSGHMKNSRRIAAFRCRPSLQYTDEELRSRRCFVIRLEGNAVDADGPDIAARGRAIRRSTCRSALPRVPQLRDSHNRVEFAICLGLCGQAHQAKRRQTVDSEGAFHSREISRGVRDRAVTDGAGSHPR